MASFDLDTFLKVQGKTGTGVVGAVGMAFGLPSCLLGYGQDILNILPSNILVDMKHQMQDAKAKANEVTVEVFKKLMLNTGIIEYDTNTGTFKFTSLASWDQIDNNSLNLLKDLGGVLGALQYASSFAAQLYQNYTDIKGQIDAVGDCLDKAFGSDSGGGKSVLADYSEIKSFQSGNSAQQKAALSQEEATNLFNTTYYGDKTKLKTAADFIGKIDASLNTIDSILSKRIFNPDLEPKFLDDPQFDQFLNGTDYERFPFIPVVGEEEDIFRLVFGPPISQTGQYLLTSDGLYYDSQVGGLDPIFLAISGIVPAGDKWKYDYDPNLGGKGDMISTKSLNKFTDNIFDVDLIDDSVGMLNWYDEDHFLKVLRQQRDKHVYDLSSTLQEYIDDLGEDSALAVNQRQMILSELANHNFKIAKRKKQIEVFIKVPIIYGPKNEAGLPTTEPPAPGNVPINDFSILEEYNLTIDLEKQKALVFEEGEVTGMVLPIKPVYTVAPAKAPSIGFKHLYVPPVGKGSIIYSPSASPSGVVLSLTDQIVTDGLFSIYNFLETEVVAPSSTEYKVTNCQTTNTYNNAKLVAQTNKNVFASGLSIPKLDGIALPRANGMTSALGSYLRLPETPQYQNLTYNPSGFTIETWVHVPNIGLGGAGWASGVAFDTPAVSSLTKVILGCENVGAKKGLVAAAASGGLADLDYLKADLGDGFVRGMLLGFTRDRRITQKNTGYSNDNRNNDPLTSSLSFFVAPTQSRDLSSCSWVNNEEETCQDYESFYKMKVDASSIVNSISFGDVSSQFILVDLTVDPSKNEVAMYADGQLMATSGIDTVFGVPKFTPPQLPTTHKNNSFQYSSTTITSPESLKLGPKLDTFFTPWIVGGGYTDGMEQYGNFMGGDRGGEISGLKGFLGSLKFYSKPLTGVEVRQNFKAQKGYFKNIKT